eukprot:6092641-Amphidinium_carterae.2
MAGGQPSCHHQAVVLSEAGALPAALVLSPSSPPESQRWPLVQQDVPNTPSWCSKCTVPRALGSSQSGGTRYMPPQVWEKGPAVDPWPGPNLCSSDAPTPHREWVGRQALVCSSCLPQRHAPQRASCQDTSVLVAGKSSVAGPLCASASSAAPVLQAHALQTRRARRRQTSPCSPETRSKEKLERQTLVPKPKVPAVVNVTGTPGHNPASGIKEIKLSRCSRLVVIGEHRLNGIRIRKRCAPTRETRIVLGAKDHRYLQAVREEAAVSAHIVAAQMDEHTVVYPKWVVICGKTPTAAASPVSWRIGDCSQIETIGTVHFPTALSARHVTL